MTSEVMVDYLQYIKLAQILLVWYLTGSDTTELNTMILVCITGYVDKICKTIYVHLIQALLIQKSC